MIRSPSWVSWISPAAAWTRRNPGACLPGGPAGPGRAPWEGAVVRVFISHAGPDTAWAEWIASLLAEAGFEVELGAWDWRTGDSLVARMDAALARADAMVAVFSRAYFEPGGWRGEEWQAALRTAKHRPRFLLRVRIDDPPAPPLLAGSIT